MSITQELNDLCVKYHVKVTRDGSWDEGTMFTLIMADGAKRVFSIDDDQWDDGMTAMFNWIVTRLEGDDE